MAGKAKNRERRRRSPFFTRRVGDKNEKITLSEVGQRNAQIDGKVGM